VAVFSEYLRAVAGQASSSATAMVTTVMKIATSTGDIVHIGPSDAFNSSAPCSLSGTPC
jgi:hypothetical protein